MELGIRSGATLVYASGGRIKEAFGVRPMDDQLFETRTIDGERYFLAQIYSQDRRLHYVYMLPYELLFSDLGRFNALLISVTILLFVVILGVSVWMAETISEPIVRLAKTMRVVEAGVFPKTELDARAMGRRDEIGTLYREFRIMLDRIGSLIHESYRRQLILKDTQFRTLQAQINPHFLYNTLESINWLAQLSDKQEIAQMVQALGRLFRASIDGRRVVITLKEELELLGQYVLIQRSRYGDRLVVRVDVPDDCGWCAVPKLTLQPLVENSIKYGLEKSSRSCHLSVRAQTHGDSMRIHVEDDGPGMEEEYTEKLVSGQIEPQGSGIGIKNIHERLRRLYGTEAGLSIVSHPGEGTMVTIALPRMSEEQLAQRVEAVYEAKERLAGR
jgi:two-component system sensor histidine kinase YesM